MHRGSSLLCIVLCYCVVLATIAARLKVSVSRSLCFALGLGGGLHTYQRHSSCAEQMEARSAASARWSALNKSNLTHLINIVTFAVHTAAKAVTSTPQIDVSFHLSAAKWFFGDALLRARWAGEDCIQAIWASGWGGGRGWGWCDRHEVSIWIWWSSTPSLFPAASLSHGEQWDKEGFQAAVVWACRTGACASCWRSHAAAADNHPVRVSVLEAVH